MSSSISYLHCSPTRPVNSMVGISVGFHNVYSMLTGHCRLDKITLHKSTYHTNIFILFFGVKIYTHFINLLSFGHFPDHSSPLATTLRFWVWKIIFYLLTNHPGLGENFLLTDKSSRSGRGWWRWRRRIWSRGSGLSRGNLVVLDPEQAAGNPVRVPWQFLERNLQNLTREESSGRIWFDFKEEKTSGRWFSTPQKISRRKG